ncbi:MAG: hypothetical protein A3D31_15150 [Candidatus Fluviicola riflensis]|nr:MAG: hypothetical protein CHH17_00085 [Candidatus Fluviicola riflensis]OGS78300.1 MAG: hypothetical protein A3D31_15150 [Candidatus Fluviicola riflensis]OGS85366.1 MAG: hypothetical protein A2724_12085 [Fluviicola sp. RIFCSPHIGHO2_01_FULL_43_53]OGS87408.1 MAG: hypothetical protein A3E30_08505 [Fluviicola sp. RIFCSPHIGHO2_12_FULL_43_24]
MIAIIGKAQVLPIGSGFKDVHFAPTSSRLTEPAFFPVTERNINHQLRDSAKRYSNFGHYLYQRQLIEIKDSTVGALSITPLLNLSYGAELQDTNKTRYQNTRGVRVEGTIGKRVTFTTSFYENQAILPGYVAGYIQQRGEQYLNAADSQYYTQNAVVPGAARTKPFKTDGFDYAYATGMVVVNVLKRCTVMWGNQPVFVGSGHRSMLWSDNSVGAINLRFRVRFSEKWELQNIKGRGLNLLRRPNPNNGEAFYENTSLSISTLYFQPNEHFTIGLFEAGKWFRGDSASQNGFPALFFLPLPGAATLQAVTKANSVNSLTGIDLRAWVGKHTIYGQFALNPAENNSMVYQIGVRLYPAKNPFIQAQVEYNHADNNAYTSSVSRLNFSNYNMPIAHPSGNALDEVVLRLLWEKGHWFVQSQTNYFFKQSENETLLMPVVKSTVTSSRQVLNQSVEVGYRFNRTYGFEIVAGFRYRHAEGTTTYSEGSWISVGIRTALTNHYFDF